MYTFLLRKILFLFNPENAHHLTLSGLKIISNLPGGLLLLSKLFFTTPKEYVLFGLKFKNRLGLAAGLDKNAECVDAFAAIGFGFVEIGTVTPKGQIGNPKPRLFRLPKDRSLINRMGFNNDGVDRIVERLKKVKSNIIIGGNIGKNKTTPNDQAVNDYLICFHKLHPVVHYFVVNVSSPNTPGLRALQDKAPLKKLLDTLCEANKDKQHQKPILLKIAPDLTNEQLDDIIDIFHSTEIAGIIATNTTIERSNLTTPKSQINNIGNGGLSGSALKRRSTEVIRYLHEHSKGTIPIIGVGGISKPEDAIEKLDAGAKLVQVYSGLVYEGPNLVRKINKKLFVHT